MFDDRRVFLADITSRRLQPSLKIVFLTFSFAHFTNLIARFGLVEGQIAASPKFLHKNMRWPFLYIELPLLTFLTLNKQI